MNHIKIFGIKNCNTMKNALTWLDTHKIQYEFHDYKKQGVDADILSQAIHQHGWDHVINRKGTTWRQLPDALKETINNNSATAIALEHPSIIKRPLLFLQNKIYLGFKDDMYRQIFNRRW